MSCKFIIYKLQASSHPSRDHTKLATTETDPNSPFSCVYQQKVEDGICIGSLSLMTASEKQKHGGAFFSSKHKTGLEFFVGVNESDSWGFAELHEMTPQNTLTITKTQLKLN